MHLCVSIYVCTNTRMHVYICVCVYIGSEGMGEGSAGDRNINTAAVLSSGAFVLISFSWCHLGAMGSGKEAGTRQENEEEAGDDKGTTVVVNNRLVCLTLKAGFQLFKPFNLVLPPLSEGSAEH